MSTIPILKLGAKGKHVRTLQTHHNELAPWRGFPKLVVDGELGPVTWAAWRDLALALGALRFTGSKTAAERRWIVVVDPDRRTKWERARATSWRKARAESAAKAATLRERAYKEAARLVGVMEKGGNNRGPEVEKIIRGGGGQVGDPWCGWFLAYVYARAGSTSVVWQWGSVRLWLPLTGIRRTSTPRRGDPVRFSFDHIGMFVRDLGTGYIETIEGNTGATGARSDSTTGGDGVYRKSRSKTLVRDYLEVTR